MLKYYFLLFLTLSFFTSMNAQTPIRLIKKTKVDYNTATGKHDYFPDTIYYSYSFGRGSNMKTGVIQFDTAKSILRGSDYICYDNIGRIKTKGNNAAGGYHDTVFYIGLNTEPDSLVSHNQLYTNYEKYFYNTSRKLVCHVKKSITSHSEVYLDSINYAYTGNNLTHSDLYQNKKNAGYSLHITTTATYNTANKPVVSTYSIDGIPKERTNYIYNINNTLKTCIREVYASGTFINGGKYTYVYNTFNDVVTDSTFQWSVTSGQWQLRYTNHYTYDASRNMIADSSVQYIITPASNYKKKTTSYNANNDPLVKQYLSWNNSTNTWAFLSRGDSLLTYTYQPYNPTSVQGSSQIHLRVYPNPASSYICFDANSNYEYKSYSIFDVTGRIYRHQNIANTKQNQYTIPIADLPIGVYILTIDTKDNRIQKTFIKE